MKILVTGGTGLVGYAIQQITLNDSDEFIFISTKDCDLTCFSKTYKLFSEINPDMVIHLAACVGGLFKNMNYKVDMFEKNILINVNVVKSSYLCGVKRMVCCLSTCIFPNDTLYPINESMLHDGPPHTSNDSYAYSKRMLEVQCNSYNQQYGTNYICVIPTNVYGENDNYSIENGHVIPALIQQCYIAKKTNSSFVVKGTGTPLRQFIYSKDLAFLILWVLRSYDQTSSIILSVSERDEISIEKVAQGIAKAFNYEDHIVFDTSFSDGQYKKTADNGKLMQYLKNSNELSSFEFTKFTEGLKKSVSWFVDNYDSCRK